MLKNTYVRIALVIVLVIILYYLVITLARSTAGADDSQVPLGESVHLEDAESTRDGAWQPR